MGGKDASLSFIFQNLLLCFPETLAKKEVQLELDGVKIFFSSPSLSFLL